VTQFEQKTVVMGDPDERSANPSFVERQNLTMRWACAGSRG
jgi:hypothetical protein